MLITKTPLEGAALIEPELREDDRGFFTRAFCREEFEAAGLDPTVAQTNISFNHKAGTLRGLHYQREPHAEAKTVRCFAGEIYDVIVDYRPESPTYLQHYGVHLTAANHKALYIPRGFAHAYLTLTDGAEVHYQVTTPYAPGVEGGLRWDDPALAIEWPHEVVVISDKDAAWPLLDTQAVQQ